jgi:protein phosphatase 1G
MYALINCFCATLTLSSGMEDAHVSELDFDSDLKLSLFGVFDGHGGPEVAAFSKQHISEVLRSSPEYQALRAATGCGKSSSSSSSTLATGENSTASELEALLGSALQRSFLELDCRMSTPAGIKEMRVVARAEDRRRRENLDTVDLEEAAEAAEACGLSFAQVRALVAAQINARLEAKHASDSDDDEILPTPPPPAAAPHAAYLPPPVPMERSADTTSAASGASTSAGAPSSEANTSSSSSNSNSNSNGASNGTTSDEVKASDDNSALNLPSASSTSSSSDAYAGLRPTLRKGGVGVESGATAVVAVVGHGSVVVANAGDSRAVLCRANGRALDLSVDHKPEDPEELSRIQAAGGSVTNGRVEGNLNLSRAVGDLLYKRNLGVKVQAQMISAFPDIQTVPLEAGDRFLVLCCDGIWNVLSSQEVVDFVSERLNHQPPPSLGTICDDLVTECLAPDTDGDGTGCDNMTAMVVLLPGPDSRAAHDALAACAAAAAEEGYADVVIEDESGTVAVGEARVAAAAAEGQKRPGAPLKDGMDSDNDDDDDLTGPPRIKQRAICQSSL